jgi:DNA-binding beta-propeller fold protein YncE
MVQSVGGDGLVTVTATSGSLEATSTIYVGTPPAGEVLASVPQAEAWRVATAAGGRYLLAAEGPELLSGTLPDLGFPVSIPLDGTPRDIAVNAAGTIAYAPIPSANGVDVVDLTTDQVVEFIPVASANQFSVALSPDESRLVVGTVEGVEVVDLATGTSIGSQAIGQVDELVRNPVRPFVYTVSVLGDVYQVGVEGEVTAQALAFPENIADLAVSPDGSRLYALGDVIHVWNLDTGSIEGTLTTAQGDNLALTPDGKFLYVMNDDWITIIEPVAGLWLRRIELGNWLRQIGFAGDLAIVIDNSGNSEPDAVHFVR